MTPLLDIKNQRDEDLEKERTRNRFPLSVHLEVDPKNYQRVRFTTQATIYKINTQKHWYCQKCSTCGKILIQKEPLPKCKDHGPQETTTYSYCFKAIVNDGSTTTSITCFSDQVNTLTRDCNEVLAETMNKDPYTFPPSLKELEGTTHTFQFHFDTGSTTKRPDFILDTVFKNPTLALPAPVPIETPEPQTTVKRKETLLQDLTEVDANKTNPTETTSQQTNPQSSIPTSPKSACTESETQELEDEDSMKKGDGKSKLPDIGPKGTVWKRSRT
nr:hypothetical protein [Tanacetum cinerariifolium]